MEGYFMTTFFICLRMREDFPPRWVILRKSSEALGVKSSYRSVHRAILKNSEKIEL